MTEAVTTPGELIEAHQGLVRSLAMQVQRRFHSRFDLGDLVAYGQIGLLEAAREFDPARGTQFSTYAYYRIRGAIYDGVSKMDWGDQRIRRQIRFRQMAGDAVGTDSQEATVPLPTASSEADAAWLLQITRKMAMVYLVSAAGEISQAEDSRAADSAPSTAILRRELHERLVALIDELPDEERQLIKLTYFGGETLQAAAVRLGISKSWASRLHAKSLERLGLALKRGGLAD